MEALVATLAIQVRRFKLQISANLWENFGDGFADTTGGKQPERTWRNSVDSYSGLEPAQSVQRRIPARTLIGW
jgi:hypothetical protein